MPAAAPAPLPVDPASDVVLQLGVPGWVYVAGAPRELRARRGERAVARARGHFVEVSGPDRAERGKALARWYRRTARELLGSALAADAERLGLHPQRLAIRDQRTRWGSCSTRGTVSLNWRLVMVPPPVARYVIVHELCHLEHPNHSPAFWRALAAALPEWRDGHSWLRRHALALMSYRPAHSAL